MHSNTPSTPKQRAILLKNESPVYALMEKPSLIDYPGFLCAVFFISGCNFSCGYCHNAVLMRKKQKNLCWNRLDEVCRKFKSQWVDAACITGGEPTLEPHLVDLIKFFKKHGFKIKLDSNGSCPAALNECLPLIDYVAIDIKADLSDYPKIARFYDKEKIKESIRLIMGSKVNYEFRTTVVTPFHTDEQMQEIGKLIKGAKRYCLQTFVPKDTLPDPTFRTLKRTTPKRLEEIKQRIISYVDEIIIR